MLTRKEREILKTAGSLITRELLAGEAVGIHHFGKFYTTELEVSTGVHQPGENVTPDKPTKFVHVIRFRAWEKLKKALHDMPTNGESDEPSMTEKVVTQVMEADETVVAQDRGPHGSAEILQSVLEQPEITEEEDESLPFCPHCGNDFSHLLVNPKTCPSCGL